MDKEKPPRATPLYLRSGMTMLEVVVVLVVMGILLAFGLVQLRAPEARLFSHDLEALVQQGRYEAVKRQTPVAVVWDASLEGFRTQFVEESPSIGTVCTSGTTGMTKRLTEYSRVRLSSNGLASGIVWLPSGLVRTCSGADLGVGGILVGVTDGHVNFTLEISPAGGVRLL